MSQTEHLTIGPSWTNELLNTQKAEIMFENGSTSFGFELPSLCLAFHKGDSTTNLKSLHLT